MKKTITLEYINDLLIDFLPYEITDEDIEKLLMDIATVKIQKKSDIFFYNGRDTLFIQDDTLGISIIEKIFMYYHDKNPELTENAMLVFNYLDEYFVFADMRNRVKEIQSFLQDFLKQENTTSYSEYIQNKLKDIHKQLTTNQNYTPYNFSLFEEYIIKKSTKEVKELFRRFNQLQKFEKSADLITDLLNSQLNHYPNKIYQLNHTFTTFPFNHNLQQLYGDLENVISANVSIIDILNLLKESFKEECYDSLIHQFQEIKSEIDTIADRIDVNNYKELLEYIHHHYHLGYQKIKKLKYFNSKIRGYLKEKQKEMEEIKKFQNAFIFVKEFLLSGLSGMEFCKQKERSYNFLATQLNLIKKEEISDLKKLIEMAKIENEQNHFNKTYHVLNKAIELIELNEFSLLDYSMTTTISLHNLLEIAERLNPAACPVLQTYIKDHMDLFESVHLEDYLNQYLYNGILFQEEQYLTAKKYLNQYSITEIRGNVEEIINRILLGKALPQRKSRMISKDLEEKLDRMEIEETYKVKKNTI